MVVKVSTGSLDYASAISLAMMVLSCQYESCVPKSLHLNRTIVTLWKKNNAIPPTHLLSAMEICRKRCDLIRRIVPATSDEVSSYLKNTTANNILKGKGDGARLLKNGLGFSRLVDNSKAEILIEDIRIDSSNVAEALSFQKKSVNALKSDESRWGKEMYQLFVYGVMYERIKESCRFAETHQLFKALDVD